MRNDGNVAGINSGCGPIYHMMDIETKILVTIAPNNFYAKSWFWIKFALFQLSTYYPAARNRGFFPRF
jgi:hypothetical protein